MGGTWVPEAMELLPAGLAGWDLGPAGLPAAGTSHPDGVFRHLQLQAPHRLASPQLPKPHRIGRATPPVPPAPLVTPPHLCLGARARGSLRLT